MLATVILIIAILGASSFRYHAALGARKADLQATAARTALLLCESWRGVGDPNTFDPTQLTDAGSTLAIESSYASFEVPAGFTVLGIYKVTTDGADYYAMLSWKDMSPGFSDIIR